MDPAGGSFESGSSYQAASFTFSFTPIHQLDVFFAPTHPSIGGKWKASDLLK